VTICFGRLGTSGQSQTKTLPEHEAATKHAEMLIREKLGKGYTETALA
jgi:predicted DNA-binding WGR domain protein